MKNITIDGVEYNITPVIKEIKKDYEILSVITNNNKFIEKVYNQDATIEPYWKIHSVKRLSDGEIFTIGDKVVGYNNSIAKIKTIDLVGEISLNIGTDKHEGFSLKNLKKTKTPLFTTEDKIDIFKDDNIYWVNIHTFDKVNCNKYNDDLGEISIKSLLSKKYECKAVGFSTKVKAEEYILMNKPCLSYNEVLNATKIRNKNTFETLKELVKSKIQQSV